MRCWASGLDDGDIEVLQVGISGRGLLQGLKPL